MVFNPEISETARAPAERLLFRAVWNAEIANMFVVRVDSDGEYVSEKTNDLLERTFGLKTGQVDGIRLKDFMDPEMFKRLVQKYDVCLNENKPLSYLEEHEMDNKGTRFWRTTILPVVDDKTQIKRIFGISFEITSLKKAEQLLQEDNEVLEQEVAKRTQELQNALSEMERISVLDKLTGLYNRHKTDQVLIDQFNLATRYQMPFGIILLDLDDFKTINDSYGHYEADKLLKSFAQLLQSQTRKTDIVSRWGGDEFMVIVPHANQEDITTLANNLHQAFNSEQLSEIDYAYTVSIGISLYQEGDKLEDVIIRTDKALYQSKQKGKNAISIY